MDIPNLNHLGKAMSKLRTNLMAFAVLLTVSVPTQPINACTGTMLKAKDGSVLSGRTIEFGAIVDTSVVLVPRGYAFVGQTPKGDGLPYTSKYATVGLITYQDMKVMDGLNEAGLASAAFYFPTFAEYTPVTAKNQKRGLSPTELPNWVLSQFASVAEVRQALEREDVVITPTIVDGWGAVAPPMHYAVWDKTGASIVIEPIGGRLVVHDSPLGTVTNSPPFDWHMINLRNYIALDPRNVPPVKIAGETFSQLGQGSGMHGLPGDFTPPSRFVRVSVFAATAIPSKTGDKGIQQVFHILNNFDIPVGVAREEIGGKLITDYTQATVARDSANLRYYFSLLSRNRG
jgi:choloylglycine hydrolase